MSMETTTDSVTGWDPSKEKLLCTIILDDSIGNMLSPKAGEKYFRAFVVEELVRKTVHAKFRFRYNDSEQSSWYITSKVENTSENINNIVSMLSETLLSSILAVGIFVTKDCIKILYPPDNGGDPNKTTKWLKQQEQAKAKGN